MATILDLGLLKGFTDIFVWILVFLIVYGGLEVTNLLKNKGLHALFAFVITAVVVLTGGATNIITAMAPWVIVIAALFFFILLLSGFVGVKPETVVNTFGGKGTGVVWYVFVALIVILVVAWTQRPQELVKFVIDEQTGENVAVEQTQRPFIGVLTNPKLLGLFLVLGVGAMTLALMTGAGGTIGGMAGH
ncbi:hypothetical protein HYY73_03405 [Candidatus Woesearchaeota archaeon]|nr:hypothetical protein [Candidatus Woesearchaeota archaeon]